MDSVPKRNDKHKAYQIFQKEMCVARIPAKLLKPTEILGNTFSRKRKHETFSVSSLLNESYRDISMKRRGVRCTEIALRRGPCSSFAIHFLAILLLSHPAPPIIKE